MDAEQFLEEQVDLVKCLTARFLNQKMEAKVLSRAIRRKHVVREYKFLVWHWPFHEVVSDMLVIGIALLRKRKRNVLWEAPKMIGRFDAFNTAFLNVQ